MRKIGLMVALLMMASVFQVLRAQNIEVVRGNCTPAVGADATSTTRGAARRLPTPRTRWDADKTYRQLVVLVSFTDCSFTDEHTADFYNDLFNTPGFNQGLGSGCVADYFREQSAGLFNALFDIIGPIPVNKKAKECEKYGGDAFRAALKKAVDSLGVDFAPYDWDGDKTVEQVIFIYAGYGGNESADVAQNCIWPNTSSFSQVQSGAYRAYDYTASAELFTANISCGLGTICHEFSHSLGLPDIYPNTTGSQYFSVCDEWDLMDGGNFTNMGWCPPNYTALEKMLLGWLTPVELDSPATIIDMKPISEGGETYIIHHTATEYLLLENHQWTGWDAGLPGKGLLITHVDYNSSSWSINHVNTNDTHQRYSVVHADSLDYNQWELIAPRSSYCYANDYCMNNRHLSTSPYPWSTDSTTTVVDALANLQMFNSDATGSRVLRKPITNIQTTDDGLVSFYFMGGDPVAVKDVPALPSAQRPSPLFDLQGRCVVGEPGRGLYIRNGKKILIK